MSSRIGIAVVAAFVIASCTDAESERKGEPGRAASGAETAATNGPEGTFVDLEVEEGELERTIWTLGDQLYGLNEEPRKLAGVVHSPLAGAYSPAAVLSPHDERLLAYGSFLDQRPVIRVHSLGSGSDSVVDKSAYSMAWHRDGALAYFKGVQPRVLDPARYPGHVIVRDTVDSRPVRWTDRAARYIVSAWAGDALIVHRLSRGWPNLVVFEGPGQRSVLARRAALVAVSPDGAHAFITREPDRAPVVAVVDVASGRELATLEFTGGLDPASGRGINYVAESGSWAGETVVAGVTDGLGVFNVTGEEINLQQVLAVDPNVFPIGLTEPKIDSSGRYVVSVAELMQRPRAAFSRTALMECDLVGHRCVVGRSAPSYQPPRPIYNPSRP
ncbi:MAG: hypothetical protein M3164_00040 [Actinomycetota bacterium]|nr:hypothetical protein [Actinomycetota bacterium]